eukprot:5207149-Amphidinium_carterae.4
MFNGTLTLLHPNRMIVGGSTGSLQTIPIIQERRSWANEMTDDPQTAQLVNTMDEFSTSMNECTSKLTLELEKLDNSSGTAVTKLCMAMQKKQSLRLPRSGEPRVQAEKGRLEAELELFTQENEMLKQRAQASQMTVHTLRHEAGLFRDKMFVDTRALCEFHCGSWKR